MNPRSVHTIYFIVIKTETSNPRIVDPSPKTESLVHQKTLYEIYTSNLLSILANEPDALGFLPFPYLGRLITFGPQVLALK